MIVSVGASPKVAEVREKGDKKGRRAIKIPMIIFTELS